MDFKQQKKIVEKRTKLYRKNYSYIWRVFYGLFMKIIFLYLIHWRRGLVKKALIHRKSLFDIEYCKKCHICCDGCVAQLEDGLCGIWYRNDMICQTCPIFSWEVDLNPNMKKHCRFYWKD